MSAEKVHVEIPILRGKTACGLRIKSVRQYVWLETFRVTCKRCKRKLDAKKGDG